jgi:cytochrome c biogenesis protein CcmG/thiol:disulfide interchange protein DsbE
LAVALVLSGCASGVRSAAPPHRQVTAGLAGSPPVLAVLHARADRLLGGGETAFTAELRRLRGYPVVIDKWASWCAACQSEFPQFQRASLTFGRRVAFLGLDGKDHDPAAVAFLRQFPVTYPSYTDPDEQIARSIRAATYYPQTIFYDRRGRQVYAHVGEYASTAALVRDVRRYALG